MLTLSPMQRWLHRPQSPPALPTSLPLPPPSFSRSSYNRALHCLETSQKYHTHGTTASAGVHTHSLKHTHIGMHARAHTHTLRHTCTYAHTHTHARTHTCTHTHVRTHKTVVSITTISTAGMNKLGPKVWELCPVLLFPYHVRQMDSRSAGWMARQTWPIIQIQMLLMWIKNWSMLLTTANIYNFRWPENCRTIQQKAEYKTEWKGMWFSMYLLLAP